MVQHFNATLAYFHCSKWPNVGQIILPSGHTAQYLTLCSYSNDPMYYAEQFYTKVQTKKNNKSLSNHNIWNKAKQKENNFLVFYI